jgi:hypothetical protein
VSTPPASIARYPQPIQAGELRTVTPPWSTTCTAAMATASNAPTSRTEISGTACPRALTLPRAARSAISCVITTPNTVVSELRARGGPTNTHELAGAPVQHHANNRK